jgi:protein phosphatase
MGNVLSEPVTSVYTERKGTDMCKLAYSCINGYRNSNEDSHASIAYNNKYFNGVFDGHSGNACSKFISNVLPKKILNTDDEITEETIKKACAEADSEFLDTKDDSGTTATFSILQKKENGKYNVLVGNVGDSWTLILKKDEIMCEKFVTVEHKPYFKNEQARIETSGGFVETGRVNGMLAVSRAFGDPHLKQHVISEPDVHTLVCEDGDIIVHICDGITESNFAVEQVRAVIRESLSQYQDIAITTSKICLEALLRGSNDNLSCMIIILGDGNEYKNNYPTQEFFPGSFELSSESFALAFEKMANYANKSLHVALNDRLDLINGTDNSEKSELFKFLSSHPIMKLDEETKEIEKKKIKDYLARKFLLFSEK